MMYEMEELLPVVAKLSRKYTSGESTSISYEKAQQLMEAVLYCVGEFECVDADEVGTCSGKAGEAVSDAAVMISGTKPSASEAYELGRRILEKKVLKTKDRYQKMMCSFEDYGNRNLYDTAVKGITGFFRYYDINYAPQNTIITMDYPTLNLDISLKGIDAIDSYVDALRLEQDFLQQMPKNYVTGILKRFDSDYREAFYNISAVLVRHLVCRGVVEAAPQESLWEVIQQNSAEELQCACVGNLERIIQIYYQDCVPMVLYFTPEIRSLAAELKQIKDASYIPNVAVI